MPTIVGATVGGVVLFLVIAAAIYFWRRRRSVQLAKKEEPVTNEPAQYYLGEPTSMSPQTPNYYDIMNTARPVSEINTPAFATTSSGRAVIPLDDPPMQKARYVPPKERSLAPPAYS